MCMYVCIISIYASITKVEKKAMHLGYGKVEREDSTGRNVATML